MNKLIQKISFGMLTTVGLLNGVKAQVNTATYSAIGNVQTFTVPICVNQITIECFGAAGANATGNGGAATGGLGGYVKGILTVNGGDVLNIYVGGVATGTAGGFNGGGSAGKVMSLATASINFASLSGGGGGASDVRLNGTGLTNRVIVAGGGGGAGSRGGELSSPTPSVYLTGGNGGGGGGQAGSNGADGISTPCKGGKGGTVGVGGLKGIGCPNNNVLGSDGAVPNGGNTSGCCNNTNPAGGGGGGGYLQGGGGGGGGVGDPACNNSDEGAGGGGAGGSNFTGSVTAITSSVGIRTGNGLVTIQYVISPISVSILASSTVVCPGQSATLTAVGAPTYTWSNGANSANIVVSPTSNANYSVVGSSGPGCNANAATNLSVSAINITPSSTLICAGQDATLTASSASSYTWSTGANTQTISVTPLANTSYSVSGQTGVNCVANAAITLSVTCIGLKEYSLDNSSNVYPNPAKEKFVLEGENMEKAEVKLSNVEGRIISVPVTRTKNGFEFDVKQLSSGIYFILITKNNITTVKKVMVD
jgi:hypothetical protein